MTRSGHEYTVSPALRVIDHGADTFVVSADGTAHRLSAESAALVHAILDCLDRPRTRDEIVEKIAALSEGPIERVEVIDEALALLQSAGALIAPPPSVKAVARGRLVLCVSGAVAASGAPDLAARLQRSGFEVRVAMTRDARRFVSPLVLEAVTHQPVARTLWEPKVPHIALAEWAELVLVCPASATTLSRIASGDCSDLVAAIAVGTRAPVVIAPSMNGALLESPSVQRNLATLREDGFWLVGGGPGVELAHAPAARAPIAGAMPAASAVVELACFVAAQSR